MQNDFIPFSDLKISRQKAIRAIHSMQLRTEQAMNDAQVDHGTQSPQWAEASARYEKATGALSYYVQRYQFSGSPFYLP